MKIDAVHTLVMEKLKNKLKKKRGGPHPLGAYDMYGQESKLLQHSVLWAIKEEIFKELWRVRDKMPHFGKGEALSKDLFKYWQFTVNKGEMPQKKWKETMLTDLVVQKSNRSKILSTLETLGI